MPVSSERMNQKVVFMCAAAHSGTTLLGLILGSHPDCFYAGEVNNTRLLSNPNLPPEKIRKISCKICGVTCPVWSDFSLNENVDVYEQLSKKSTKSVIIDSTKELTWLRERISEIQATSSEPFLIFLQRDGRAVVSSWFRKQKGGNFGKVVEEWVTYIQQTQSFFNQFRGKKLTLSYEKLATSPEQIVPQICHFLEIDYHLRMLDYYQQQQHPIGGNVGTQFLVARAQDKLEDSFVNLNKKSGPRSSYYKDSSADIRLDLRWQQELSPQMLQMFEVIAGETNKTFKWEG